MAIYITRQLTGEWLRPTLKERVMLCENENGLSQTLPG
jgi:hypothetical protein